MDSKSKTVVVTGFGPFGRHPVNSSWEAVKDSYIGDMEGTYPKRTEKLQEKLSIRTNLIIPGENLKFLPNEKYHTGWINLFLELFNLGLGKDVAIRILQLPVIYKKTKEQVSKIWETLQPQFIVHVGVASSSKVIILEQCGRNRGYRDADICGFLPEGGVCLSDGPDMIESTINMKTVCKNISVNEIQVLVSRDAGRYVCDYTYYLSLHYGNGCAAFIHVPPLSNLLTADLLGRALQIIIQEMLKQFGKARK